MYKVDRDIDTSSISMPLRFDVRIGNPDCNHRNIPQCNGEFILSTDCDFV